MPPVIIPGVCRFSYIGTHIGRPWANVLHFDIDTDLADDRAEAIVDQAKVLNQAWTERIRDAVTNVTILLHTAFVDLDSLDGITGTSTDTDGTVPLPASGLQPGAPSSSNVSVLIRKLVSSGRSQRPGRMYQVGASEAQTDGNNLGASAIAAFQSVMDLWLPQVNQESSGLPGGATYSSRLVVPHVVPGSTQGTFAAVDGLLVDSMLATQRRRLRS